MSFDVVGEKLLYDQSQANWSSRVYSEHAVPPTPNEESRPLLSRVESKAGLTAAFQDIVNKHR